MLQGFRTWVDRRRRTGVRALAFTCSRHRPLMLRHCIMQLQRQSYPIDHAIYVNSLEEESASRTSLHYGALLHDLCNDTSSKILIKYGKSKTPHENYASALKMINIDDYDLFLKIDDDDIYFRSYVKDIVDDFVANRWDHSGSYSCGLLNGYRWYPEKIQKNLGFGQVDLDLNLPESMPSSSAFSRKAIRIILEVQETKNFEDIQWRRILAQTPNIVMALRNDRNFVYNIHGGNVSTATWLQP
jgi:hypothetical protein